MNLDLIKYCFAVADSLRGYSPRMARTLLFIVRVMVAGLTACNWTMAALCPWTWGHTLVMNDVHISMTYGIAPVCVSYEDDAMDVITQRMVLVWVCRGGPDHSNVLMF